MPSPRFLLHALLGLLALCALSACAAAPDEGAAFRRYAERMVLSGAFRSEYAPPDAPFTQQDLLRNFVKVAFEIEDQLKPFSSIGADVRLSKWTSPIRYRLEGDGLRRADRETVAQIAAQLSKHSGLRIAPADAAAPNVRILFISPNTRRAVRDVQRRTGRESGELERHWLESFNPPCFANFETLGPAGGGRITAARIFIKGELDNPLRRACLTEEMTQILGLTYDHPDVRPSIFNDDQEFIALTAHDARLIEILYDPRLAPGMGREEAAAIAREITFGPQAAPPITIQR